MSDPAPDADQDREIWTRQMETFGEYEVKIRRVLIEGLATFAVSFDVGVTKGTGEVFRNAPADISRDLREAADMIERLEPTKGKHV